MILLIMEINKKYNLDKIFSGDYPEFKTYSPKSGYCIYKITNKINNKAYIGDCKTSLYKRFCSNGSWSHKGRYINKSEKHLYRSMNFHSPENFELEILSEDPQLTEKFFIEKYSTYENGYNLNSNGLGPGGTSLKGKIAINNNKDIKFIQSELLEEFLSKDWSLGYGTLNKRSPDINQDLIKNKKGIFSDYHRELQLYKSKEDLKNKTGIYSSIYNEKRSKNSHKSQKCKKVGIYNPDYQQQLSKKRKEEFVKGEGLYSETARMNHINSCKKSGVWDSQNQRKKTITGYIRLALNIKNYLISNNKHHLDKTVYQEYINSDLYLETRKIKYETYLKYLNYEN